MYMLGRHVGGLSVRHNTSTTCEGARILVCWDTIYKESDEAAYVQKGKEGFGYIASAWYAHERTGKKK